MSAAPQFVSRRNRRWTQILKGRACESPSPVRLSEAARPSGGQRSADFQVCGVRRFPNLQPFRYSQDLADSARAADLEVGDTAGLETCATLTAAVTRIDHEGSVSVFI